MADMAKRCSLFQRLGPLASLLRSIPWLYCLWKTKIWLSTANCTHYWWTDSSIMASSSSKESPVENQMESVMQLMSKRMRGEVTNAEIEAAVSGILTTMGAPPASASTSNTAQNSNTNSNANSNANPPPSQDTNSSSHIQVDTGNYDGDQDDADADADAQLKQTVTKETIEPVVVAVGSKKNNKSKKKTEQVEDSSYQDKIDRIPMGKVGAKMMTTFGDGPTPDTRAIEAALLGTRMTLQMAILDARAIRRRAKQTFEQARQTVVQRNKSSVADAADPNMLYRALSGYDRLSLQPKCGFDMEQLTWLFPEEMRAYQRWNVMHSEYQKSAEEDEQNAANGGGPAGVVQEPDTEDNNTREDDDYDDTQALGGHLKERAAQFDARTERMKSEWYIQFAKVRQGSFLLKGLRHRKSKVEVEWEANRKSIRGRRPGWESMPASSVRFLHWVGFEPPTIHPPNEETTQALAFMGYDIMGKILEKVSFKHTYIYMHIYMTMSCRPFNCIQCRSHTGTVPSRRLTHTAYIFCLPRRPFLYAIWSAYNRIRKTMTKPRCCGS
jgi:hypothetical protein